MSKETKIRVHLVVHLALFALLLATARAQCGPGSAEQNRQNKLAMYRITLRTFWSRTRFPRHYPEWRPPAQFGKLVGRSHDSNFVLYRLGQRLSVGARQYVETGRTDGLDTAGSADYASVLHSFTGPAIPQGEGVSMAKVFLDGNHTLVSLFARINPSPDWFVGLDSFQLCVQANWVDSVTVELDPLDGGTDNGFTFTAANWPTQPQGIAYRITSHYPAHPAGSFYYPNLPRLPPIATLTFTKLREYTLTETYHDEDVEMEFVSNENQVSNGFWSLTSREIDPNRDLNEAIAEERREMDTQRYRYWTPSSEQQQQQQQKLTTQSRDGKKSSIINSIALSYANAQRNKLISSMQSVATTVPSTNASTSNLSTWSLRPLHTDSKTTRPHYSASSSIEAQKAHIIDDIQRKITLNSTNVSSNSAVTSTWRNITDDAIEHRRYRSKHHRMYAKGKRPRTRPPRDCKVGEWGAWSACSRSCGVGETQRTRRIMIKPRRGGRACPPLKETKWCGSVSPCHELISDQTKLEPYYW